MTARPFNAERVEERVIALWVAKAAAAGFYRPSRGKTGESIDIRDVLANGLIDPERGEVWIAGFRLSFPSEMLTNHLRETASN